MNDRQINDLVRMAMEVDELESGAADARPAPGLHLADMDPASASSRSLRDRRPAVRAWWIGAGLAAAAVVAIASMTSPRVLPTGPKPGDTPIATNPNGPSTPHNVVTPSVPEDHVAVAPAPARERVDLGAVERCIVVAIYRDTRAGVRCVQFKPQVWSENKCLSEITPSELRQVTLGQPCTPANQTLLVALAGPQKKLPQSQPEAEGLATCILDRPRDCGSDSKCLATAATECVPPDVSVRLESVAASR